MPYYSEHFENSNQDWEPVSWIKKPEEIKSQKKPKIVKPISFSRQLINARQRAQITLHKLAQALGIKVKDLASYENGKKIPENNIIARINKILGCKLPRADPAFGTKPLEKIEEKQDSSVINKCTKNE